MISDGAVPKLRMTPKDCPILIPGVALVMLMIPISIDRVHVDKGMLQILA